MRKSGRIRIDEPIKYRNVGTYIVVALAVAVPSPYQPFALFKLGIRKRQANQRPGLVEHV